VFIQEVVSQVSQQFVATVPDIKKVCDIYAIRHGLVMRGVIGDVLVENEYIERVEDT